MVIPQIAEVTSLNEAFSLFQTANLPHLFDNLHLDFAPDLSKTELDLLYFAHSGEKFPSTLVRSNYVQYTLNAQNPVSQAVYSPLEAMFYEDWKRLWNALQMEYNPIHNYDATETSEDTRTYDNNTTNSTTQKVDETHSQTVNNTDRHTGTDTLAKTGTDTDAKVTAAHTENVTDTFTQSGKETETHVSENSSTKTIPDENTIETENYPVATPYSETTTENGKETVTEKGGNVRSVWGFDSTSPKPSEMTLARGGTGTGAGNGDGTAESDGHVTTNAFDGRSTTLTKSGAKTVTTDHNILGDETTSTNGTDTVDKELTDRQDLRKVETIHPETNETNTLTHNTTDTTTYGGIMAHEGDLSGTDTADTTTTDNGNATGTETTKHSMSRVGNIGVTTTQQMLQSEYELRKQHFLSRVFADLDSVLTLPIYC